VVPINTTGSPPISLTLHYQDMNQMIVFIFGWHSDWFRCLPALNLLQEYNWWTWVVLWVKKKTPEKSHVFIIPVLKFPDMDLGSFVGQEKNTRKVSRIHHTSFEVPWSIKNCQDFQCSHRFALQLVHLLYMLSSRFGPILLSKTLHYRKLWFAYLPRVRLEHMSLNNYHWIYETEGVLK